MKRHVLEKSNGRNLIKEAKVTYGDEGVCTYSGKKVKRMTSFLLLFTKNYSRYVVAMAWSPDPSPNWESRM